MTHTILLFLVGCAQLQYILCDTEAKIGCPPAPNSIPFPDPLPHKINAALTNLRALLRTTIRGHGISAGLVYRGKKIWEFNDGKTGNGNARPTSDTIYRVGSISKTFSLALLLKAVQEGKIEMDDPVKDKVANFLPVDPFKSNTTITWAQLVSHTSGISRFGPCDLFNCDVTTEQMLAMTSTLIAAPGTTAVYSNYAYALLGHFLAEYVYSGDYYQMIANDFLQPLGLQNTGFEFTDSVKERLAQGYSPSGDPVPKGVPNIAWYKPAGEMYSSVNDLLVWVNEFLGYRNGVLGSSSVNFTTRTNLYNHIYYSDPNGRTSYGVTWENVFVENYMVHRKYGSIDGYSAIMGIVSELDLGLVILWNTNGVPSLNLMVRAMEILLPAFKSTILDLQPMPPGPANLTPYVGTYVADHPLVGQLSATITTVNYLGRNVLKFTFPLSEADNYLVLPESKEPNVLTIWVPAGGYTCQELTDTAYYLERVVFGVDATGNPVSLNIPGIIGDLTWVKQSP